MKCKWQLRVTEVSVIIDTRRSKYRDNHRHWSSYKSYTTRISRVSKSIFFPGSQISSSGSRYSIFETSCYTWVTHNIMQTYLLFGWLESNDVQITAKWLTIIPIPSSVSVIWLQLAILNISRIIIFFFIVRMIIPQVVLNLIATDTHEVPKYRMFQFWT